MKERNNILVITDDDESKVVRRLLKQKIFPLTRSSILSAIDLLKHIDISIIVLDKTHKSVDALEFILNVQDVTNKPTILVPKHYQKYSEWNTLKKFEYVDIYDEEENTLLKKVLKLNK